MLIGERSRSGAATIRGIPGGRTLHLLDLENLIGDPFADVVHVRWALAHWPQLFRVAPGDLVVIAANPAMAFEAKQAWPGALVRAKKGKDGADLALLAECEPGWVTGRFARVIVGSGDHIFAPRALELQDAGLVVVCVSRPASLSADLRRAVSLVRHPVELAT